MENVTDALIIAFSVFFFLAALSISMLVISKVRTVADVVIRREDQSVELKDENELNNTSNYRIVGMETITPVLYRYYKDETTIVFLRGAHYNSTNHTVTFGTLSKISVFNTDKTDSTKWGLSYYNPSGSNSYGYEIDQRFGGVSSGICVVNLADEIARNESWVGNTKLIKEHVDKMLKEGPLSDKSLKYVELLYTIKREGKKTTDSSIITYVQIVP